MLLLTGLCMLCLIPYCFYKKSTKFRHLSERFWLIRFIKNKTAGVSKVRAAVDLRATVECSETDQANHDDDIQFATTTRVMKKRTSTTRRHEAQKKEIEEDLENIRRY